MTVGEALLGAIFNVLLEKLAFDRSEVLQFLCPKGIESQLKKCRMFLLLIQNVLEDAEDKSYTDRTIEQWLENLQDLAYELDDIVDELATEALSHKLMETRANPGGGSGLLLPLISFAGDFQSNHIMSSRVDKIFATLEELADQIQFLGLKSGKRQAKTADKGSRRNCETTSLVNESHIFGREQDEEKLLKMLLPGGTSNEPPMSVIPIVGMGGLGKTTLAQLVYNNIRVKESFEIQAWVCVSDDYDIKRITRDVLDAVSSERRDFRDLNLNMLQQRLRETLSKKRVLLVMDDVWNDNYEDWDLLQRPFCDVSPGSKIIVTTRNASVASTMSFVPAYELEVLASDESLSLLAMHASRSTHLDAEFKEIGGKIVKKCKYLPLAVKSIAGILRGKDLNEWEDVLNDKVWVIEVKNRYGILPALRLSFQHLPSHLKRCFAYCALFPKDHEFNKKELVLLWMAEGFLQQQEGRTSKTMEKLGDSYFEDLRSRSFFQKSTSAKEGCYVMHDLMHDLAQYVAGNFCLRWENELENEVHEKVRHLSFTALEFNLFQRFKDAFDKVSGLRTFLSLPMLQMLPFFPRTFYGISQRVLSDLLPKSKCLRTLCLTGFNIHELPDSIGTLKRLRYLNLANTRVKSLPETMGDLCNLQTLLLLHCRELQALPKGITRLTELRHLDNLFCVELEEMPTGMGQLSKLQTLSRVILSRSEKGLKLKELGSLPLLQGALSIFGLHNVTEIQDARDAKLVLKSNLTELELYGASDVHAEFQFSILEALQPHKNLSRLVIYKYGGTKFPSWMEDPSFRGLKNLSIGSCGKCTPLPSLGQLPMLKVLSVHSMYELESIGPEFYGHGCGTNAPFHALETLEFFDMPKWKDWSGLTPTVPADEFHHPFPKLRKWIMSDCPNLKSIPLIPLPALNEIEFQYMKELEEWSGSIDGTENVNLFPQLKCLRIAECPKLISMQNQSLPSLRDLTLNNCKEELLRSFSNLSCLTRLKLESISELISLSDMTVQFSLAIESLEVYRCRELACLWPNHNMSSEEVGNLLPLLKRLEIHECPALGSQCPIPMPRCLEELEIEESVLKVERLPATLKRIYIEKGRLESASEMMILDECSPTLKHLHIAGWSGHLSLRELLSASHDFASLTKLLLWDVDDLQSFPGGGLPTPNLIKLSISTCKNLKSLPDRIDTHQSLNLEVYKCPGLESFPPGKFCPTLNYLFVKSCEKLKLLPNQMATLTCLEFIELMDCPGLESFPQGDLGFGLPPNLKRLRVLRECGKLKALSEWGLHKLTSLKEFSIRGGYPGLVSFNNGDQSAAASLLPPTLTFLKISGLPNLESVAVILQNLTSLQQLTIAKCPELRCLLPNKEVSQNLSSLRKLIIRQCQNLTSLCLNEEVSQNLSSLRELTIDYCPELTSVFPNEEVSRNLSSLQDLNLIECPRLLSLPIEGLSQKLWSLNIHGCPALEQWYLKNKREFLDYIPQVIL